MSVFRSAVESTEEIVLPDPEPNKVGASVDDVGESEPLEIRDTRSGDLVLESLGIDDDVDIMPESDQDNLKEVKQYILDIMKQKGLKQTVGAFKNTLQNIKWEMGIDSDSDPSIVLDRIGGMVKAWKGLSFIRNPMEKRSLFMKLGRARSSEEMDRIVMDSMDRHKVWR